MTQLSDIWGVCLVIFGGVAWLGQVLSAILPAVAVRLGLAESEKESDPAFFADSRAEAFWDSITLWVLPVSGVLLIAGNSAWTPFGLVGGGTYTYFAGRGILSRIMMGRSGIRIGSRQNVIGGVAALGVWGVSGIVTIIFALLGIDF